MPGQQRMRVSKQGKGDTAGKLVAMMQASGEICRKNGVRMKQFGVFIVFFGWVDGKGRFGCCRWERNTKDEVHQDGLDEHPKH